LKRKIVDVFLLAALALLLAACSPRMLLVRTVADELAGSGGADEEDLGLARDAAAFHLKLSEQVLRQTPAHLALAEAVTGGFTQYAYAFIAFDADKQESKDARAAQRQRERAARMYARAHRHAMAALEAAQPGFAKALAGGPGRGAPPAGRRPPGRGARRRASGPKPRGRGSLARRRPTEESGRGGA